jgi:hypothetical protein
MDQLQNHVNLLTKPPEHLMEQLEPGHEDFAALGFARARADVVNSTATTSGNEARSENIGGRCISTLLASPNPDVGGENFIDRYFGHQNISASRKACAVSVVGLESIHTPSSSARTSGVVSKQ